MSSRHSSDLVKNKDAVGANTSVFKPCNTDLVLAARKKGLNLPDSARYAGISKATLQYWLDRGAQQIDQETGLPTGQYGEFFAAWNRITAQRVAEHMEKIEELGDGGQMVKEKIIRHKDGSEVIERQVAPPSWQARAWILERAFAYNQVVQQETQEHKVLEVRIVETDRWREVNGAAGKIIEGEVVETLSMDEDVADMRHDADRHGEAP